MTVLASDCGSAIDAAIDLLAVLRLGGRQPMGRHGGTVAVGALPVTTSTGTLRPSPGTSDPEVGVRRPTQPGRWWSTS